MPKEIAITKLKPHPNNELIYGQEDVSDLVAQIKERGRIVVPLIINKDHTILSGHRRWGAAKQLGLEEVPCEVRTFDSPDDELEFLLHSNVSRKKTREQTAREGIALEEVLSAQSLERRKSNLKQFNTEGDESSHSDEANGDTLVGRTRDEVAKALRIGSGKQFDRMKAVVNRIDELKKQDKSDDAALFVSVLNRSPSAANDLLAVNLDSLSDDDKTNLKSGKAAPRSFTQEEKEKAEKIRRETSYGSAMKNIKWMDSTIKELSTEIARVKDSKQKQKLLERIEKQIAALQGMLPSLGSPVAEDETDSE